VGTNPTSREFFIAMNFSFACSQSPDVVYAERTYSHYPEEFTMPMNRIQFQPGLSMPDLFWTIWVRGPVRSGA